MVHYELILFYALGLNPRDAVEYLGYASRTAYRWHRIYRLAAQRCAERLGIDYSMPSSGTNNGKSQKNSSETEIGA